MNRYARFGSILASACLALALAGPASASSPGSAKEVASGTTTTVSVQKMPDPSADPKVKAYLATLSPAEAADVKKNKLLATITTTVTDVSAPASSGANISAQAAYRTGCWVTRYNVTGKSAAQTTLFKYYHTGQLCSDGSKTTSSSVFDAGGQTFALGWKYQGVLASRADRSTVEGRSYSKHGFIFGSGGWDVQNPTPCIRVYMNVDGRTAMDEQCGTY